VYDKSLQKNNFLSHLMNNTKSTRLRTRMHTSHFYVSFKELLIEILFLNSFVNITLRVKNKINI